MLSIRFQSTFPRGERHVRDQTSLQDMNFNPRSRVGNDSKHTFGLIQIPISIHVPAWGTTSCCLGSFFYSLFQSTFPRGERQQILTIFRLYFCIGITNLHFTSLLLSEFFILFISFVRFFKFFMVRVSLGFSVCF